MTKHHALRILGFALLSTFLTSCFTRTPPPASFPTFILVTQDPNASPTLTPFQPALESATPLPTLTAVPEPTITFTPSPAPPTTIPPVDPAIPTPVAPSRTNYIIYATLDFGGHTLAATETIRYYNYTGVPLSEIVFSVQPNRYGNCFTLVSIAQDNVVLASYNLNDQRLTAYLPQPLQPGTATTFSLDFTLTLPAKRSDGLFGYDFNQVNLVDWYPFIVPYYSGGWILHDPMPFGEHLVYDSSDIEVNLKAGADVVVAASAPAETSGEWTRYRMYGARTFALSASDEFLMSESAVGTVAIRTYYFDGYQGAGQGMLRAALSAVGLFDVKFAPYPYQSLSVVQADMNDGQEYDGLVFLSTDFYGQYGGEAKSNLITIGVHEIAHQWWFGLVGNDQAVEPWLDEAMAIYSERIFYEFNYPRYGDWWWQFRVDYFGPGGYVDTSIYDGGTFRAYTNAVYLNGGYFIEALRTRMGDEAFYRFLKDYAARYSRGRATSYDFFAVARQNTDQEISDLVSIYFQGDY